MSVVLKNKKTLLHTLEEQKNELAIKLLSLKDEAIVRAVKVVFDDLTTTTKKTSKAKYNKEIGAAVQRVRSGKLLSNEEAMKQMDTW